jgi:hypothetical protein
MTRRAATALALAAALVAAAGCGDSDATGPVPEARAEAAAATAERTPTRRPRAVVEDCSTRSMADFPGAFVDPGNVVAAPLVWVGAAYTPPEVVREFGGNKLMLLVANGHRVTLQLSRRTHRVAALAYGPLPQGEVRHRDAHRAVTFIACRHGEPSGSSIDGLAVTFWSGFVLAREPACVPVHAWVDDEPAPRRLVLGMGVRRCA